MQKRKLRFAIVGAGAIASHHINALQQVDNAEVIFVCRRDKARLKELANIFNLSWIAMVGKMTYFNPLRLIGIRDFSAGKVGSVRYDEEVNRFVK